MTGDSDYGWIPPPDWVGVSDPLPWQAAGHEWERWDGRAHIAGCGEYEWPPGVLYFQRHEFACKDCGIARVRPELVTQLDRMRISYNRPIVVTSGYRSPSYNAQCGGARHSAHIDGRAVDILVRDGSEAHELTGLAREHGFAGIGVSRRLGASSGFLHLDISRVATRPALWSY